MAKGTKTGGRQKGTPNKKTCWLKTYLDDSGFHWNDEFLRLYNSDLSDAANRTRMDALLAMLPYMSAKVKEREAPQEEESSAEEVTDTSALLSVVSGE